MRLALAVLLAALALLAIPSAAAAHRAVLGQQAVRRALTRYAALGDGSGHVTTGDCHRMSPTAVNCRVVYSDATLGVDQAGTPLIATVHERVTIRLIRGRVYVISHLFQQGRYGPYPDR